MVKRQSNLWRLCPPMSHYRPISTEPKSKIRRKTNFGAGYFAFVGHLKDDQQEKGLMRSWVSSRPVNA
jgi:hypothetical protein